MNDQILQYLIILFYLKTVFVKIQQTFKQSD